jgi:hypothetical protein
LLATPEDFQRHFEILSDEALLETNRDELVEMAREVYDEEIARRGLGPEESEELAPGSEVQATHAVDEMVLIATFGFPEEANMARGLLESASIPSQIKNELAAVGGFEASLLVPASFEEQAIEILESQISDEELAAQAEAAGIPDEELAEDENFTEGAKLAEHDD